MSSWLDGEAPHGASPAFRGGHTPGVPGELHLTYLNRPDVEALALTNDEILVAVDAGLRAQGLGETVIEPRVAGERKRPHW